MATPLLRQQSFSRRDVENFRFSVITLLRSPLPISGSTFSGDRTHFKRHELRAPPVPFRPVLF
jgi:hypothetical protein